MHREELRPDLSKFFSMCMCHGLGMVLPNPVLPLRFSQPHHLSLFPPPKASNTSPSSCKCLEERIGGTEGEDYELREEQFTGNNEIRKPTITATIPRTKVSKRERERFTHKNALTTGLNQPHCSRINLTAPSGITPMLPHHT